MEFVPQKLIDLRWDKRLKQTELALLVGVEPGAVCQWEKGKRLPSAHNLLKLADALNVEPRYFYDDNYQHDVNSKAE